MAKYFLFESMLTTTVVIFFLFAAITMVVDGQQKVTPGSTENKIDGRIDIAVVMTAEFPIGVTSERKAIKDAYIKLSDYFEMGEKKTQFAIADCMSSTKTFVDPIVLNWTSDPLKFKDALDKWSPKVDGKDAKGNDQYTFNFSFAFNGISDKLFPATRDPARARAAVVIVANALEETKDMDEKAAKRLYDKKGINARIYAIYREDSRNLENRDRERAEDLARTHLRTYPVGGRFFFPLVVNQMADIKKHVVDDLCRWTYGCLYASSGREACISQEWLSPEPPSLDYALQKCGGNRPGKQIGCVMKNCEDLCDSEWPWQPCGGLICGKRIISRETLKPKDERFQVCSPTKEEDCPPCPVLPPGPPLPPLPPVPGKPGDPSATKGPGSATTSSGKEKEKGFEYWWLIGLLIGLVVLLIVVILIVVFCRRKRSKKNEELLKKKLQALEMKLAAKAKIETKSEKSGSKSAMLIGAKSGAAPAEKGVDFVDSMDRKGKGARDESVLADISIASSVMGKKTKVLKKK